MRVLNQVPIQKAHQKSGDEMKRLPVLPIMIMALLLFSMQIHAAPIDSAGLLDNILNRFSSVASSWQSKMLGYASWLFWSLVLISMVWTYGMMALKKADIQEVFAETVRFFTVTGFFWWILSNGPAISVAIIHSLRTIAANASGLGNDLSPSSIIDIGFDIVLKVVDQSSIWSPVHSGVGLIVAAIILVVLALISVNMLLLLISGWILAYAGVFLLGFGGGRWTSDIAINFYKTVLGIGIQLFSMILIIGVGQSFIDQYYAAAQGNTFTLKGLFVMLIASIILLMLVNKVPPMLASIVWGGSIAGISSFGAGAAIGATAATATAAAVVGSAVNTGLTSMAGGASAMKSAFQQAQKNMAEGSGLFCGGSVGSQSSDEKSGNRFSGSGGFAAAMGNAGRFAADVGANLAKGAGSVAKDKAEHIIDTAKEKIAQTTGGKIASAIDQLGTNKSGDETFPGNTLCSGVAGSRSMSDEVSQFVNKGPM